ncbi:MAG TPA: hypothetical protein VFC39_18425, partial [Acidobacteriaceae bacterium]|nr:hypothetical protein [Acidobacteriaceae bacterium]
MTLRPLIAAFFALPLAAQTGPQLIPVPREFKAASTIALSAGLRITCTIPCDPDDAFAIADLRDTLAARGIPLTDALTAPYIFIARFSTPVGRETYH